MQNEEIQEADGGDSDEEGTEFEIFDTAYIRSQIERQNNDDFSGMHVHEISNGDIAFVVGKESVFEGNGANVDFSEKVTKAPEDWVPPEKKDPSEPDFNNIDNPGGWSQFVFCPVYKKVGTGRSATYKYVKHELPTGCRPVPPDENGKRIKNGWEFHYKGWKSTKFPNARNGATPDTLFPESRASSLDASVLVQLGLDPSRIKDKNNDDLPDALFFYQLILPMCDTSTNPNDPRKNFYSEITKFSNLYRCQKNIGFTYGHKFQEASMVEFVKWDGCIVRDGLRGGGNGAIYRRWLDNTADSDNFCQKAMTLHRWNQLKRIYKLNNNDSSKKRGEPGYDPSYKYDLIYNVMTANVRAITKFGELDLTGDETTWAFGGFGEKGTKIVSRIQGKPGVSKGGQTVIVSAVNRIRPYWYQHRHSDTPRYGQGFTGEGPAEVRSCIDALEKWVAGREGNEKKIFAMAPHLTWDNYFSGVEVFHYTGQKGFGLTMTCRRNRLPKGIEVEFMHKGKTDKIATRIKAARHIEPVILVKEEENYEIVLTSFQSTSSCNLMSVNSISENKNFVEARSRGRKDQKRIYVIEQNMSRLLYLKTYSRIDSIDHLIKITNINYRTWKYWHSPVNHAKAMSIAIAHDIYLEVCEGNLLPDCKNPHPVDYYTFRDILSRQMCLYDPRKQKYQGDEKMRSVLSMNKVARKRKSLEDKPDSSGHITKQQYKAAKSALKCICKDLSEFEVHKIEPRKNPAKCAVCGVNAYKSCVVCGVALHNCDVRGAAKGRNCFQQWHNDAYLGLCYDDRKMMGVSSKEWKPPTPQKVRKNI